MKGKIEKRCSKKVHLTSKQHTYTDWPTGGVDTNKKVDEKGAKTRNGAEENAR